MRVAGEKTQDLVLFQWARDATGLCIKVSGAEVTAGTSLRLLGVTFDRLLHFGAHCAELRRKVRPRIAQLRRMTRRSWDLGDRQLRAVANGYVRRALEYAAGAWMPASSPSHLDLVDRELQATARVVTGCPVSTPVHALMAEAGMPTARARREVLSARMLGLASSLPEGDPLRALAEAAPTRRLKTTTGWRDQGREAPTRICRTEEPVKIEERLHVTEPPWHDVTGVSFALEVGPDGRRDRPLTRGGRRNKTDWRPSRRRPHGCGRTAQLPAASWTEEVEPRSCSRTATHGRCAWRQDPSAPAPAQSSLP